MARQRRLDDPFGYGADTSEIDFQSGNDLTLPPVDPDPAPGAYGHTTQPKYGGANPFPAPIDPQLPPPLQKPASGPETSGPPQPFKTRVMEDTGRLNGPIDPMSPKDEFLSYARDFAYDDTAGLLKFLQEKNPSRWSGWGVGSSPDQIRYSGSNLAKEFGGVDSFDVVGNFGADDAGWRWGVGEGGGSWSDPAGGGGSFTLPRTGSSFSGLPGGSGGGSGTGSSTASTRPTDFAGLKDALAGLFPGGAFNQSIVDRRTDSARGALERQRKSRLATNQALLADRGLIGDGPEGTAYGNMEEDLYNTYADAVSGIYADESENADARMIQALQIAAGMTESEAQNAIDWFRAQTEKSLGEGNIGLGWGRLGLDRDLGMGNLALGNLNAVNNYNLGLANYGLNRDRMAYDMQNGDFDRFLQLFQTYLGGAGTAAGGYR